MRKKNFEKNPNKNDSQCRKKIERGDSLVSPGMVCYAEKQVKPFWFTSLGQMVQFDTIIFCRTFKNYFGQFVWIEKKRVTIIVAFHFMKRRLKTYCKGNILPGKVETSREPPKSAPYLRLKNSKRSSKCQSIGELGTLL